LIHNYHTAIVTGASRGIGTHIARALANEGMNLILAARHAADLNRVAHELSPSATGRVIAVPTDLTDRNGLNTLVSTAEAEFGTIDVLVNNAGLDSVRFFHQESPDVIEQLVSVNLTAPIVLTRLVLPGMLERRRGHIVNLASLAAKIPFPFDVMYATSKAGLAHFTTSLRAECRGTGVSASVILAGQFTDIGVSAQALKEAGVRKPKSVPTSAPEAAGQAVIRALQKDLAEIAIPGPALVFTRIPQLGTLFLKGTGVAAMLKEVATIRGRVKE
jgi:short-subunit dehydrogenase